MGLVKRRAERLGWDDSGVAPIIWAIVLIGGAVVGIAGYTVLVSQPDITYNITDAGISFAGIDIGSDMLILIVASVIILIILFFRRKPKS